MPCGQTGRLVQAWTSRTSPMAPAPDPFAEVANAVAGVALVAHLGHDPVLAGGFASSPAPRTPRGPAASERKRACLAPSPPARSRHASDRVWPRSPPRCPSAGPASRGNRCTAWPRETCRRSWRAYSESTSQRATMFSACALGEIVPAHAADANSRDIQLLVGGRLSLTAQHVRGDDREERRGSRRATHKISPGRIERPVIPRISRLGHEMPPLTCAGSVEYARLRHCQFRRSHGTDSPPYSENATRSRLETSVHRRCRDARKQEAGPESRSPDMTGARMIKRASNP